MFVGAAAASPCPHPSHLGSTLCTRPFDERGTNSGPTVRPCILISFKYVINHPGQQEFKRLLRSSVVFNPVLRILDHTRLGSLAIFGNATLMAECTILCKSIWYFTGQYTCRCVWVSNTRDTDPHDNPQSWNISGLRIARPRKSRSALLCDSFTAMYAQSPQMCDSLFIQQLPLFQHAFPDVSA